jgi:hypothetical protein
MPLSSADERLRRALILELFLVMAEDDDGEEPGRLTARPMPAADRRSRGPKPRRSRKPNKADDRGR